jgi:hypothetical protein
MDQAGRLGRHEFGMDGCHANKQQDTICSVTRLTKIPPAAVRKTKSGPQALSSHPEKQVRRQADTWLQQFQWTMEAWQVADALLHLPDSPLDVQYFCAQTLKKKAQRDFEELPQGAAPCASLIFILSSRIVVPYRVLSIPQRIRISRAWSSVWVLTVPGY